MIRKNINIILLLLLVISALVVVKTRHDYRVTFTVLQDKLQQKQHLQFEQGRLLIERATWSRNNSVSEDSKQRFEMSAPDVDNIIMVKRTEDEGV